MSRDHETAIGRRRFVHLGLAGLLGGGTRSARAAVSETAVDDIGDPYDPTTVRTVGAGGTHPLANRSGREAPAGVGIIRSFDYAWIEPGAPDTGNRYALRLVDWGGVDPQFRPATAGDLTIDCRVRHHTGGKIAYLFNDADSRRSGFRAFTNGKAGRGLYVRNVFGGADVVTDRSIQDGAWHRVRVVLDADDRDMVVYLDGERVGRAGYHGRGWQAGADFRVMGRKSGSRATMEYDRFMIDDRAVHPTGDGGLGGRLVHYELEDGAGSTVENAPRTGAEAIAEKRRLIEEIRTTAGSLLPDDRVGELEQGAASLLDAVEGAPAATRVVERLLDAEAVTRVATAAGREPARRLARFATDLASSIAVGRLTARTLRAGGWAARRLRSIVRDIRARGRRLFDLLVGRPLLGADGRAAVDATLAGVERAVGATAEAHDEDLEAVGERLLDDRLEDAIGRLPDPVTEALDRMRERSGSILATAMYDRFQFHEADPVGETPAAPGVGRAMELAVEPIQGAVADDGPDAVDFLREADTVPDVGEVIDRIETASNTVIDRLDGVEAAAGTASTMAIVTATLAMGAFATGVVLSATVAGIAAGATVAAIAAKLSTYAAMFGTIGGALNAIGFGLGVEFFRTVEHDHHEAVGALLALTEAGEGPT